MLANWRLIYKKGWIFIDVYSQQKAIISFALCVDLFTSTSPWKNRNTYFFPQTILKGTKWMTFVFFQFRTCNICCFTVLKESDYVPTIYIWSNYSDLTRVFTPKGSWERELPLFQGNPGWWSGVTVGRLVKYYDLARFTIYKKLWNSSVLSSAPPKKVITNHDRTQRGLKVIHLKVGWLWGMIWVVFPLPDKWFGDSGMPVAEVYNHPGGHPGILGRGEKRLKW